MPPHSKSRARTEPPDRAATPSRAPRLPLWGAVCFFASGAAGLLYEVVWSKQLSYLLGNSLHAVAAVVAAFLCGLALGARFLGVPLARRGRGARIYALLEIGVGLLGILSLPVLRGIEPLVGQIYRALSGEGTGFALARLALLFVLLLPPAALMGATLPVLVAHFERGSLGPILARLYALNTFGAVVGSVLGGFALLPGIGLAATSRVAAALNVAVGIVAWNASRAPTAEPARPTRAPSRTVVAGAERSARDSFDGATRVLVAVLFALSGFAALVFQIAWVRLFGLVLGSSVYSFSAVLGVYLLGLGLGSAVVERFMRRGVSLAGLGWIELALGLVTSIEMLVFRRLPEWMLSLAQGAGVHWGTLFAGETMLVASLLLVPCALLGAAFPIATRLLQRDDGGHATGFAYAVNTSGTIAGSLVAGFLAIPALGVQGTHLSAVSISTAIGLACLALARARRETTTRSLALASVAVIAIAAIAASAPGWDPALMGSGSYRPRQAATYASRSAARSDHGSAIWKATRNDSVLYYREGLNGSVLVATDLETRETWLRVGGKVDASTSDMLTQVLLGLVPGACADSGAHALVIGLGSGATLASLLAAGAGSTEIVELEPAVVEASRFFPHPGPSPLDDPRVRLVIGDARTRLAHGDARYGVIVSEPSNPWIAGVNNLFTVDSYRQVRRCLAPDCVFCQWIQAYELSAETFASMVASFSVVFPEGDVFVARPALDVLLIAAPPSRRLALERLRAPAARRMLDWARLDAPEAIAGYYAGPISDLRATVRDAPLNTDDRPIVEYRAPRDLIMVGGASTSVDRNLLGMLPFAAAPPAGALFAAWSPEDWYQARTRLMIDMGDSAYAQESVNGARRAGLESLAARLEAEISSAQRGGRAMEEIERSRALFLAGRNEEGRQALERAVAIDSSNGDAWVMLAERRRIAGDLPGAESALSHARGGTNPDLRARALFVAGALEIAHRRPLAAIDRFREAQRASPRLARGYMLEVRARLMVKDTTGALEALRRGRVAIPDDPELRSALAALGARP
jgi:spermidine synthase